MTLRQIAVFAMLGSLQFVSKQVLEVLPNIELVSALTMVYTLVYRRQALYPIFLFILMEGVLAGFALWWIPYLYLWPTLWAITLLLPRNLPLRLQTPVYAGVCALFGLAYGSLYAPFQAVAFLDCDWDNTLRWIKAGLPWDLLHAQGNAVAGLLIVPLTSLLRALEPAPSPKSPRSTTAKR